MVFQIDTSMVIKYNLGTSARGKWCYLDSGVPVGFFDSRFIAEKSYGRLLAKGV